MRKPSAAASFRSTSAMDRLQLPEATRLRESLAGHPDLLSVQPVQRHELPDHRSGRVVAMLEEVFSSLARQRS